MEKNDLEMESWRQYKQAMKRIDEFMQVVIIRDGEVWIREEVCLGRPEKPEIRMPIHCPVEYLGETLHRIGQLVESVTGSLKVAIGSARKCEKELESLQVLDDSLSPLRERTEKLQSLLNVLMAEKERLGIAHHPELLLSWYKILDSSLKRGNPGIRVKVLVTYLA